MNHLNIRLHISTLIILFLLIFSVTTLNAKKKLKYRHLEDYLIYAKKNNPKIKSSLEKAKSIKERMKQVISQPDPNLKYAYSVEEVETRVGPQKQKIGISQKFITGGKLKLKGKRSYFQSKIAEEEYNQVVSEIFFAVKKTYLEYYYITKEITISEETLNLLKYIEIITITKYKVGQISQPEVLQIQVELGKLENRIKTLVEFRKTISGKLKYLINLKSKNVFPYDLIVDKFSISKSVSEITEWIRKSNPEIKRLNQKIKLMGVNHTLALKMNVPDITASLDYIDTGRSLFGNPLDNGKDPIVFMVSVNLPFRKNKYRAAAREVTTMRKSIRLEKEEVINRLEFELERSIFKINDALRRASLYRDSLIPKAVHSLKVAQTAFINGKTDFISMFEPLKVMLELHLAYERAVIEQGIQMAMIEFMAGSSLPKGWKLKQNTKILKESTSELFPKAETSGG
ncbi:TolC family protein [bacterium]|nr:TolC family protein [bacterium]